MRIYRYNDGREHFIFLDHLEAISYLTSEKYKHLNVNNQIFYEAADAFKHWTSLEIQDGDWIRTCDGRIVQCLKRYKLLRYGKETKYADGGTYLRWGVRVCFGIFTWYTTRTGKIDTYLRMMADPKTVFESSNVGKSGVSAYRYIAGRYLTKDKRIFAYWMALTLDPIFAFKKANIKQHWKSQKYMTEMAFELAKDPYVIEEMSTYRPMEEIRKSIKQLLADNGLGRERAINSLKLGLDANELPVPVFDKDGNQTGTKPNPKTGGKNHRDWTELLFKVEEWAENEGKPGNSLGNALDKPASLKMSEQAEKEEFILPPPRPEILADVTNKKEVKDAEFEVIVTPSSQDNKQ